MFTYVQKSGAFRRDGGFLCNGYSGFGIGKNNPEWDETPDIGPIPCGLWTIGPAHDDPERGPVVLPLTPDPSAETYGRSNFLIHGDFANHKLLGTASHGCIILPHEVRSLIAGSGDTRLTVVELDGQEPSVC